jgi:hypothetical protein
LTSAIVDGERLGLAAVLPDDTERDCAWLYCLAFKFDGFVSKVIKIVGNITSRARVMNPSYTSDDVFLVMSGSILSLEC